MGVFSLDELCQMGSLEDVSVGLILLNQAQVEGTGADWPFAQRQSILGQQPGSWPRGISQGLDFLG